jgi:alanine dehydrogenase
MAPPNPAVLVIFCTGPQAVAHERALRAEHDFHEVRVVGRNNRAAALNDADAIVTATNSASPLFAAGDVKDGTHLMCVGSGSAANAEIEGALLARATSIRVDHRPSCLEESGEIVRALEAGLIDAAAVRELGDVVNGSARGRDAAGDITVYKSVGNGTQDAGLAALLLGIEFR